MAILLTETTKKMLGTAMRLEKCGATEAARDICVKCVRQVALSEDGEDVLAFFYGESVYETLKSVEMAMEYVLVGECAKLFLGEMKSRSSANGMQLGKQAWISRHPQKSDEAIVEFFAWLCGRHKESITERDKDRFVNAAIAIKTGAPLMTDDAVAGMYPMELLRFAVNGRLRVMNERLCAGGYAL